MQYDDHEDVLEFLFFVPYCYYTYSLFQKMEKYCMLVFMEERCPKCSAPLAPVTETATGRKLQRCSKGSWNNGTTEKLDEACPECGKPLVLFTTNSGKKMKKCSTAGWDSAKRKATGCTYVEWLKAAPQKADMSGGEEFLPPEPPEDNKDIEV